MSKSKKFGTRLGSIFEKYDADKNFRISADEMKLALERHDIKIHQEDVGMLRRYFVQKYDNEQITKK